MYLYALFFFIEGGQRISWSQRISAAIGVAKGIQFLHGGIMPGLFSNNLKITDIFLDQNLVAKISSYNLPLVKENTESMVKLVLQFFNVFGCLSNFIYIIINMHPLYPIQCLAGSFSSGMNVPSQRCQRYAETQLSIIPLVIRIYRSEQQKIASLVSEIWYNSNEDMNKGPFLCKNESCCVNI